MLNYNIFYQLLINFIYNINIEIENSIFIKLEHKK